MEIGGNLHYKLSPPVDIHVGAGRFLHGPALVETRSGEWLCAYQHSQDDPGTDSTITQSRSRDRGRTWTVDGIIHDERSKGVAGRNPGVVRLHDGTILMCVQRNFVGDGTVPGDRGQKTTLRGSILIESADDGHTYSVLGPADPVEPEEHHGAMVPALNVGGRWLWSGVLGFDRIMLYASDDGRHWRRDQVLATLEEVRPLCDPDVWEDHDIVTYPSIVERADGVLLFFVHYAGSAQVFTKASEDGGRTWSRLHPLENVRMRHPTLTRVGRYLVMAGAQMFPRRHPSFFVSADGGGSWLGPHLLNAPDRPYAGYTSILPVSEDEVFIAFSQAVPGRHAVFDILGVYLSSLGSHP